MRLIKLLLPLILLVPSFISCDSPTDGEVIILAGQSNMEGFDSPYSSLADSTIEYYSSNHDNVKISYNCYFDYQRKLSPKPNSNYCEFENVKFGQGRSKDLFGPEVGIAKYLGTKSRNKNYYLIKSCEGATYLRTDWSNEGHCFKTLISDIDESLKTLKRKNINPKITTMIWMQGEADSQYSDITKDEYLSNTKKLINGVLNNFPKYIDTSTFKWVDAGITTEGQWPKYELINSAKKELVKSNTNYRYVSLSESLPKINVYHYTQESYLRLGEEFGKKVLN